MYLLGAESHHGPQTMSLSVTAQSSHWSQALSARGNDWPALLAALVPSTQATIAARLRSIETQLAQLATNNDSFVTIAIDNEYTESLIAQLTDNLTHNDTDIDGDTPSSLLETTIILTEALVIFESLNNVFVGKYTSTVDRLRTALSLASSHSRSLIQSLASYHRRHHDYYHVIGRHTDSGNASDSGIDWSSLIDAVIAAFESDHTLLVTVIKPLLPTLSDFTDLLRSLYVSPLLSLIDTVIHRCATDRLATIAQVLGVWQAVHARFTARAETVFGMKLQLAESELFGSIINSSDKEKMKSELLQQLQSHSNIVTNKYWAVTHLPPSNSDRIIPVFVGAKLMIDSVDRVSAILLACNDSDYSRLIATVLIEYTVNVHCHTLATSALAAAELGVYQTASQLPNIAHIFAVMTSLTAINRALSDLVVAVELSGDGALVALLSSLSSSLSSVIEAQCQCEDRSLSLIVNGIDTIDWCQKRDLPAILRPKVTVVNHSIAHANIFLSLLVRQCNDAVGGGIQCKLTQRFLLFALFALTVKMMGAVRRLSPSKFHFPQYLADLKALFAVLRHWRGRLSIAQVNDMQRVEYVDACCGELLLAIVCLESQPETLLPQIKRIQSLTSANTTNSTNSDSESKIIAEWLAMEDCERVPARMPLPLADMPPIKAVALPSTDTITAILAQSYAVHTATFADTRRRLSRWLRKRDDMLVDDFPALTEEESLRVQPLKSAIDSLSDTSREP